MSTAGPTTDPKPRAARARRHPAVYLVVSLVLYAFVLLATELGVRWSVVHHLPQPNYLGADRVRGLLSEYFSSELTYRVAFLSFPLTMAVLAVRLYDADPFAELGLRARHLARLPLGACQGALAHVALLAVAAWLAHGIGWLEFATWRRLAVEFWLRGAGRTTAAVAALSLCFALGRTVVPLGHLHTRLLKVCRQPWGSLLLAAIFALPFVANRFLSPLGLLNAFLLGLVLERRRERAGDVWGPLGLLAGWTAMGIWDGLLLGTPRLGMALVTALPLCISGGVNGLDGGLLATLLWTGWLVWLLRSRPAVPVEPADAPNTTLVVAEPAPSPDAPADAQV